MSVNMSILFDRSNRKIASINIFGTTMGIIDLLGLISDNKKANAEFLALANQILELEKSNVEKLKPFLLKENQKKKQSKKPKDIEAHSQQSSSLKSNSKDKPKTNKTKPATKIKDSNITKSKLTSATLQDDLYTINNIDTNE